MFGLQAYVGIVLDLPSIGHPLKVFAGDGLSMVTTSPVKATRPMGGVLLVLTRNSIYVLEDEERIYGPLRASDPVVRAIFDDPAPPPPTAGPRPRFTIRQLRLSFEPTELLPIPGPAEDEATEKGAGLPEV